jgi:predicted Zn-ribbon and HTH transcriptional regulator
MTYVRDTSMEIYLKILNNGLIGKKQQEVFKILFKYGPLTGAEVANMMAVLNQKSNVSETVRNRLNELKAMGIVTELPKAPCPVTGNTVYRYDVTSKLPVKPPRKLSKKEKRASIKKQLVEVGRTAANKDILDQLNQIWREVKKL